ncbi:TolC family protein, partial [Xanthovirga aplysinae]|uniref:TolC family protein n=1 Tax=Xanthovirga aplysinae TaxID=2529853 RepID=UPI001656DC3F
MKHKSRMRSALKGIIVMFLWGQTTTLFAQEILTKSEAVKLTLENNYDIKIARNDVRKAENNASIFNSGYLPTLGVDASVDTRQNNTNISTANDGLEERFNGVNSREYNANAEVSYVIFDGMGRAYNFKKLKETRNLSKLEARQIMEASLLDLFTVYFEVGRLTENLRQQKQTLETSKQRLLRATYNYEYGQGNRLDVLNAEVDVNNDSIGVLEVGQQLSNSKRDLNVILGRDVKEIFEVETDVKYTEGLELNELLESASARNVTILQAEKNIQISKLDFKISKSGLLPKLSAYAGYGYNRLIGDGRISSRPDQANLGVVAGVTMTWAVFDGGLTKTRIQNSKIDMANRRIQMEQIENVLERNVVNAWETYQNALFILSAEQKNVETNKLN